MITLWIILQNLIHAIHKVTDPIHETKVQSPFVDVTKEIVYKVCKIKNIERQRRAKHFLLIRNLY